MSIEALVARWGVAAVFAGAAIEGETAVVAGGALAHRHLFPLAAAMAAAAAGSFLADQMWFQLGRRFSDHRWVRRARDKPTFAKALALVERHPIGFIFAFRFLYGLRTVSPIAIGTTDVSTRLFVAVNGISAIVWGVAFSALGYWLGHGLETLLGRVHPSVATVVWILAGAAAVTLAAFAAVRRSRR